MLIIEGHQEKDHYPCGQKTLYIKKYLILYENILNEKKLKIKQWLPVVQDLLVVI